MSSVALVELISRVQLIETQLGVAPVKTDTAATGARFATAMDTAAADLAGAGTTATGAAVVDSARKYLGVPYVFGGTNPATGLDCSALVQRAYADLGITLPRIAADQAREGTAVPSLAQAKPGDLLAFNSPVDHIAIYIGNGKMIAAPQPGENVKIQDVYQTPSAIRRIIPDAPAGVLGGGLVPGAGVVAGAGVGAVRPASLQGAGGLASVPYADLFQRAAAKHGVSATLLAAVAKVESNYNPKAVSPAGAQGLMQIMPATAAGLGINPMDPAQAVDGAARILSRNLADFGSLPLALAAYNAGGGAVRRYGGIPPYAETQAYVPKVQAAMTALG